MHPSSHALLRPDHPACIMGGSGITLSYGMLDQRSNQVAQLFRSRNIQAGDVVAILVENTPAMFEIAWGAQRSGLYYCCLSSRLTASEVGYILKDCGARLLFVAAHLRHLATTGAATDGVEIFVVGDDAGPQSYERARDAMSAAPIADESSGGDMLYSSGTTGHPKGVKPPLTGGPIDTPPPLTLMMAERVGIGETSRFLSPAPLYHAAPLRWAMGVQRLGGTVVVMEKFDAEEMLALIERHRCNAGQFVPTHFVRLLKLPEDVRKRYDISSMARAVHAAAPCPVAIKEQMIEWWGRSIYEYYSGTEGNGMCFITPDEWLTHKGSVGRAIVGDLRICDADGDPLPPRCEGMVYFANGRPFSYHNDPEKTAATVNKFGWTTLGDVGWQDEDGYLYLTDRSSFMIITGGVNVYPQEIENLLITHPDVQDAAVFGVPDDEMGERVVAVVQPKDGVDPNDVLRDDLTRFCRAALSAVKIPRTIEFLVELPRLPTGKLMKRQLRDTFLPSSPDLR